MTCGHHVGTGRRIRQPSRLVVREAVARGCGHKDPVSFELSELFFQNGPRRWAVRIPVRAERKTDGRDGMLELVAMLVDPAERFFDPPEIALPCIVKHPQCDQVDTG